MQIHTKLFKITLTRKVIIFAYLYRQLLIVSLFFAGQIIGAREQEQEQGQEQEQKQEKEQEQEQTAKR